MSAVHHAVAVGAGPANLSLAALYEKGGAGRLPILERWPGPEWHAGLLFPGTRLQTPWIKDLVSLVDPRHELSFLNYLVSSGRVFSFLNAGFEAIPRVEYARYLAWAGERLDVRYGVGIDGVGFDDGFVLRTGETVVARAQHVIIGVGTRPALPPCLGGEPPPGALPADELAGRMPGMDREEPVAVVGSGQTGAECVLALLHAGFLRVAWLGRRHWFAPLDDSPTANEMYRPSYTAFFYGLTREERARLLRRQTLTSDGISESVLREIYQFQYEQYLRTGRSPLTMLPGRELVGLGARRDRLTLDCVPPTGGRERHEARHVVLATGREPAPLDLAPELAEMIETDENGDPLVEEDYSVRWKHADRHGIYLQNRAAATHGYADPNLSLLSVRAATIVNSLFQRTVHRILDEQRVTFYGD
ncbi:SidA/IucD/PvdA family monooxygenase [Nonomuraea sp. NPDC050404]|uniref:lysine N(6)-hydroxylase/L-ornithine N(5)-oxygenase family protein n=1 Tax=Nonomuraea sp. NPDC050404 TaxID=3155783 RepID=UPI0033E051C1